MIDESNPEEFDSDSTSRTESKLSDELNRLLHSLWSPNIDTVSGVFGLWQELVGEQVATHVTPVSYTHLTLPTNREV